MSIWGDLRFDGYDSSVGRKLIKSKKDRVQTQNDISINVI